MEVVEVDVGEAVGVLLGVHVGEAVVVGAAVVAPVE